MNEENPFETATGAQEWIVAVETEKGRSRDNHIYPLLKTWARELNPGRIVEIGAGQGICAEKLEHEAAYVGVDPSPFLIARAKEKYPAPNRSFVVGNAYALPLADAWADAAFSINVWFHLENLPQASLELARILKPGGQFLLVTANPADYPAWESFYTNPERIGKKFAGRLGMINAPLSRNTMYEHSLEEIIGALTQAGLTIDAVEEFSKFGTFPESRPFISIKGKK